MQPQQYHFTKTSQNPLNATEGERRFSNSTVTQTLLSTWISMTQLLNVIPWEEWTEDEKEAYQAITLSPVVSGRCLSRPF